MAKTSNNWIWAVLLIAGALLLALTMTPSIGVPLPRMLGSAFPFVTFLFAAASTLLPLALVIWLIVALRDGKLSSRKAPLQIAEERYARGEIDRQQFEEIRDVLSRQR